MPHPYGRKLITLITGLLIELAPAYVLLLPRFFGILGYILIYFALSIIVGVVSASITSSIGYSALAAALGKLICDTFLGWGLDVNVLGHLIVLVLVACCAAVSATVALHVMFSEKLTTVQ